ncbi:MAG: hypothetical protein ACNYNY_06540 [Candidatus Oxydemutatoraceae bacterium WSBS_2016_MAG_OTU14]
MKSRKEQALEVRNNAAKVAASRAHPNHKTNGDERKFSSEKDDDPGKFELNYLASFTKGMPHNHHTGLLDNPDDFQQFVKAIDSGDPRDFKDTRLGPLDREDPPNFKNIDLCPCSVFPPKWKGDYINKTIIGDSKDKKVEVRAWESQSAGNAFDLEGADAQAVTMPPAPEIGSRELTYEMGEVYIQALLRDVPFTDIDIKWRGNVKNGLLNTLLLVPNAPTGVPILRSRSPRSSFPFRGITPGDDEGPYISQFLLVGNTGIDPNPRAQRKESEGYIAYGALEIDQRVRIAKKDKDYMTDWDDWFDVQNGADVRGTETYSSGKRFITTPRDLATYVHYDALYQAYLNACLILLGKKIPFDPGLPFQQEDIIDHQQAFALFGAPHILSLVTEVATRALKAVRYQKFNVHRRLRPEALALRQANSSLKL